MAGNLKQIEKERFEQEIEIAEDVVEEEKKIWDICRDFYKGNHQDGAVDSGYLGDDEEESDFMSVNLIFSNMTTDLAQLAFNSPQWNLKPRGTLGMDKEDLLKKQLRANLLEELMNYHSQKQEYKKHQKLGTIDSKVSLGIFKVFNNIDSDKREKPVMQEGEPVIEDGEQKMKFEENVKNQEFSVKRVRPEFFLIDPRAGNFIESASWVAEKIPMRTSKAQEKFDDGTIESDRTFNPIDEGSDDQDKSLKDYFDSVDSEMEVSKEFKQTMVYEVWDRENDRWFYLCDGKVYNVKDIPEEYQATDGVPYVPLRYHLVPNKFYPIPDVWPQIDIQHSYNMARTALNSFRKMMIPKFAVNIQAFEDENEVMKLESKKTGEVIKLSRDPESALVPIQLPSLPSGIFETMSSDLRNMTNVSGITSTQRGDLQSDVTATQSQQAMNSSKNKSQWKRSAIIDTFTMIGRKLKNLIQSRMATGGVIKITGPAGQFWVDYSKEDIKGEFDVEVNYGSGQNMDEATERSQILEVLQLLSSVPPLLKQFHLPRLAENLVDLFPSLDTSMLISQGGPREQDIFTMKELYKRLQSGKTETNLAPPVMATGEQMDTSGGGGGSNQNRNTSGLGGQTGGRQGSAQGQAINQFRQQIQQQAEGGQRGGGPQQ